MSELETVSLTFAQLPLAAPLLAAVVDLGFSSPTPVQQQAIPAAVQGQDMLVSAETGSGKTLAFLLAALQHLMNKPSIKPAPQILVLTPTRELAQQVLANCQTLAKYTDFSAGLITGGDDFKRQQALFRKGTHILVATPGRLQELLAATPTPNLSQVSLVILDEADRMLDMGFRDDILAITAHCPTSRQTLLFSATLTHFGIIKIADRLLDNPKTIALNSLHDGHRNIEQQIILADSPPHKQQLLCWLLQHENYDKALVFTNSRLQATALQQQLMTTGFRVGVLHGDFDQKERNRVMALYRKGVINVLVATDLAARGLDIDGINLVINFEVPRNGITYIHRIGRSGRANAEGLAITLVAHTEWNLMSSIERFLKQNFGRRHIEGLQGSYHGPKKTKLSGKAVGKKDKTATEKAKPATKKTKIRDRDKKNIGKRRQPSHKTANNG
jgi:ATP-dependent RNA helicase SrmB